ncbi:hypothetical protein F4820DRAFT_296036 [Hypoxylon rubiginosum]|uniref:Uncharacterized protein n=1 Tax=Hypoxylon rubiginosum TaxID=110542 RepID=A0ACB9Z1Y8_9PEZI|nr:hypothetical protein F4820DRAFT_296036 [Hypoxylon rubiginosum]
MWCPIFLVLAICGTAIAAPAASRAPIPQQSIVVRQIVDGVNCTAIKDYCNHCQPDDFQCETDPRCEICFESGVWNKIKI